jgi:glycine oxidase
VPRIDGHVLVGSTVEETGFNDQTTVAAISHLQDFAHDWFSELNENSIVKTWAGLRPATNDGFPYLGRIPDCENGFVATGHFRSGIHLSTGTAAVIFELMNDQPLSVDLSQFDPHRG